MDQLKKNQELILKLQEENEKILKNQERIRKKKKLLKKEKLLKLQIKKIREELINLDTDSESEQEPEPEPEQEQEQEQESEVESDTDIIIIGKEKKPSNFLKFKSLVEMEDYAIKKKHHFGTLYEGTQEIEKEPEVGDIFLSYGKYYSKHKYDMFAEIVKITDKMIMYKLLDPVILGEYFCDSNWGSSKRLYSLRSGFYQKNKKTQRMKRTNINALTLLSKFVYICNYMG